MTFKIWAVWAGLPAPRWAEWPNGARLCLFWAKTSVHSDFRQNRSRGSYRTYTEQSDPLVPTLLNKQNKQIIRHHLKSISSSSIVRGLLPRGGELQRAEERQARTLLQGQDRFIRMQKFILQNPISPFSFPSQIALACHLAIFIRLPTDLPPLTNDIHLLV